jgi:DNA-binding IclR family transcriptional regulator
MLDERLDEFLTHHLESLEELACLLRLRKELGRTWEVAELARVVGIPEASVLEALEALCRRGFAERGEGAGAGGFRYRPPAAALDEQVVALAAAYDRAPIEVLKAMSAHAIERVRSSAMRAFSDAFVLGKKRDG